MADNFRSNLGDADVLDQYPSAASPLSIDELLKARAISAPPTSWAGGWPAGNDAAAGGGAAPAAPAPPANPAPAPAPAPRTARDLAMSGLGALQSNLDKASTAVDDIPVNNQQIADLDKQIADKSAPIQLRERAPGDTTPEGTGRVLPQYAPTLGRRIWRGVRSGLVGLATGGIPGALVGALEPEDIAGGTAYGAPNDTYARQEQGREQQLSTLESQRKNAADAWKQAVDARKERATQFRANAALGKDISTGAGDVMKADNEAAKNANETPEAKARAKQLEDANTYNDRMGRLDTLEKRVGKLPASTQAYYMLNGKLPDPKQPREPNFEEVALAGALRTLGHKPTHDEYMQIVRQVRSGRDEGSGDGGPRSAAEQAMIDSANADLDKFKAKYEWKPNPAKRGEYIWHEKGQDDPRKGLTPEEYTAEKNTIIGKLNKSLTGKKFPPLSLTFDPRTDIARDSGIPNPNGVPAAPAAQPAASSQPNQNQIAVQVGTNVYHFPNQEAANKFKAAAGIK